jgi:seryl-tRNA synthetase
MLDIKYIRENLAEVKQALAKKHTTFELGRLIALDEKRQDLQKRVDLLRAQQNDLSKEKISVSRRLEKGKKIKEMLKDLEGQLIEAQEAYLEEAAKIHNLPHESVPSKEAGNKVEKSWGERKDFSFEPKDHLELGEALDIIDMAKASQVSGTRFAYLKGKGALLEFAIINYLVDKLKEKDFIFLIPPVLVKERAMFGTGFFPTEKFEFYKIQGEDLYLAGTSEVPLASYHADEVIKVPKKYAAFSSCFRKEAGSYGKDTRGIIRVHQFDKIEMFVFAQPEKSWEIFDELVAINEEIFQELKLPYRLINISGGELGAPNAKKIDGEVWIPSERKYRELTSCSNDTDFQARRLNIKFKDKDGVKKLVHTVNDTASAIGRTIVAILENYQKEDGLVEIPQILQKYTGFKKISQEGIKEN